MLVTRVQRPLTYQLSSRNVQIAWIDDRTTTVPKYVPNTNQKKSNMYHQCLVTSYFYFLGTSIIFLDIILLSRQVHIEIGVKY